MLQPEDEEEVRNEKIVTLKLIKKWRADLETDKSNQTITHVIRAFHAALKRVSNDNKDDEEDFYKVDGKFLK